MAVVIALLGDGGGHYGCFPAGFWLALFHISHYPCQLLEIGRVIWGNEPLCRASGDPRSLAASVGRAIPMSLVE